MINMLKVMDPWRQVFHLMPQVAVLDLVWGTVFLKQSNQQYGELYIKGIPFRIGWNNQSQIRWQTSYS